MNWLGRALRLLSSCCGSCAKLRDRKHSSQRSNSGHCLQVYLKVQSHKEEEEEEEEEGEEEEEEEGIMHAYS